MRKDVDIKLNDDIEVRLKIRDTITLTSANSKSLDDLGKMLECSEVKTVQRTDFKYEGCVRRRT
jgi:hypothetical protein